mmetsp:Transcript_66087/g.159746  ORF Transcript_66087/g.159746 Transcript_66087/m.159746 type:complete len:213 (-) Transcript_66087:76-714(-)
MGQPLPQRCRPRTSREELAWSGRGRGGTPPARAFGAISSFGGSSCRCTCGRTSRRPKGRAAQAQPRCKGTRRRPLWCSGAAGSSLPRHPRLRPRRRPWAPKRLPPSRSAASARPPSGGASLHRPWPSHRPALRPPAARGPQARAAAKAGRTPRRLRHQCPPRRLRPPPGRRSPLARRATGSRSGSGEGPARRAARSAPSGPPRAPGAPRRGR